MIQNYALSTYRTRRDAVPRNTAPFFGNFDIPSEIWYDTLEDMLYKGSIRIPGESALIAFESAARNGSFAGAAKELQISRSAVRSRVAGLEKQLSIRLFERSRSGLSLTEAGCRFRDAVVAGLCVIEAGMAEAANRSDCDRAV